MPYAPGLSPVPCITHSCPLYLVPYALLTPALCVVYASDFCALWFMHSWPCVLSYTLNLTDACALCLTHSLCLCYTVCYTPLAHVIWCLHTPEPWTLNLIHSWTPCHMLYVVYFILHCTQFTLYTSDLSSLHAILYITHSWLKCFLSQCLLVANKSLTS